MTAIPKDIQDAQRASAIEARLEAGIRAAANARGVDLDAIERERAERRREQIRAAVARHRARHKDTQATIAGIGNLLARLVALQEGRRWFGAADFAPLAIAEDLAALLDPTIVSAITEHLAALQGLTVVPAPTRKRARRLSLLQRVSLSRV